MRTRVFGGAVAAGILLALVPSGRAAAAPDLPRDCAGRVQAEARETCLAARLRRAEADLTDARGGLPQAIEDHEGNLLPEDRIEWRALAEATVELWLRYGEARCDARLLGFERRLDAAAAAAESLACRAGIAEVAARDLRSRYDIDGPAAPRASIEAEGRAASAAGSGASEDPCGKAPPGPCDYCGVNACWKRLLAREDARLNAIWRAVLAGIGSRADLAEAERSDWIGRLRTAQRLWLGWKDRTCDVEAFETPNRFAHSIYSGVTAPCQYGEIRARSEVLRRTYPRAG